MECRRRITGWSLQKFSERRALPLVGEIIPHRAQGGLFQPADLRLRDADFPGNLHLGLPLIETHADDPAFALIETGDRVLQGEVLHPVFFFIFLITDLIHDIEGIAPIGVDRIIEAYRTLDRIQCVQNVFCGNPGFRCDLLHPPDRHPPCRGFRR